MDRVGIIESAGIRKSDSLAFPFPSGELKRSLELLLAVT